MLKLVFLVFVNGLVLAALPIMFRNDERGLAILAIAATIAIDVVYLTPRLIPFKYLLPGTLLLIVFAVYPVIYTVYISTTNYGTGNNLTKEQAIEQLELQSIGSTTDAVRYELQILAEGGPDGEIAFLLVDPQGATFLGTADGLEALDPSQIVQDGRRDTIEGYVALNAGAAQDRIDDVQALVVPGPGGDIVNDGFRAAFAKTQGLVHDPETDTILRTADGVVFTPQDGYFTSPDGDQLLPGWRANIGLENYQRLAGQAAIREQFARVFVWTMIFAVLSVLLSFSVGLFFALVFNNPRMRGQKLYRAFMIIPYALPAFMTALVWKGMLNTQFGVINRWLGATIPWLDGQWMPYLSILLVNTWLGYPYMFLICTGALQSIPSDLTEAAMIDGAGGVARFRRVTLPLLLVAVAPLLIAAFAFNFNNFSLIYLLTGGGPPIVGSTAGRTDILISFTYKLAFGATGSADYGLAAAVSFVIFILVAAISAFGFRFTKRLEDLRR